MFALIRVYLLELLVSLLVGSLFFSSKQEKTRFQSRVEMRQMLLCCSFCLGLVNTTSHGEMTILKVNWSKSLSSLQIVNV